MSSGTRAEPPRIAVVAPEPAPWLAQLVADLQGQGPVALFCPWALPPGLARLLSRHAPPRLQAALARRAPSSDAVTVLPGWPLLVEAPLRLFVGDRAERRLGSRFVLRAAVDRAAARWLPPTIQAIYAPSCAAERTFSAAQRRGARTHLILDLPLLRRLHQDLDEAAAHHPGATFLRNYRAGHGALRRQEAELVLATRVLCRGPYARDGLRERGLRPDMIDSLPSPQPAPSTPPGDHPRAVAQPPRLLLAGLAAARAGVYEALAALAALRREHAVLADLTLLVRPGDGAEPADLLRRPGVRAATIEERRQLAGVAAVLSPALAECYPDEVALAAARGVPVIATARGGATRWLVPPFDPPALARAIAAVLASPGER